MISYFFSILVCFFTTTIFNDVSKFIFCETTSVNFSNVLLLNIEAYLFFHFYDGKISTVIFGAVRIASFLSRSS